MRSRDDSTWVHAAVVAAATVLAFLPALGNGWAGSWDDGAWLLDNAHYRGLGARHLRWMFSTVLGKHYQPLTWLTFACDYLLWGMNPAGFHATSMAVHAAAAVLYFLLARRLLAAASNATAAALDIEAAFAALLFSAHPLRVEPVAWAADRRDVLSGFFFIAAILAYLRARDEGRSRARWLAISCGVYALSLLSKGAGLALPVVLMVLDWYPSLRLRKRRDLRTALLEKVPYFLLALAAAGGLAAAQSDSVTPLGEAFTLARLSQAAYGLTFYVGKTLFPIGLSPFYENPAHWDPFAPIRLLCAALTVLLCLLSLRLRREFPALLSAWLCYAAILFPMLGLGTFTYQLTADRYSYLACLGWPLLAAAALRAARKVEALPASAAAAALVVSLMVLTWNQSLFWRDPLTLWSRAADVDPGSSIAQLNLGDALAGQGRMDEAAARFQAALDLDPSCGDAQKKLAAASDPAELAALRRFMTVNPVCLDAYGNLVTYRASRGKDLPKAEAYYRRLLDLGLRRPGLEENLARVVAARRRKR